MAGKSGFGVLSHLVKDHVYAIGRPGFIYTAPWIATPCTRPPSAAIILAAGPVPFTLHIGGMELRTRAAITPPFISRSLFARNVPVVCFHVMPGSPRYDAFSYLAQGSIPLLNRNIFRGLDVELDLLYNGRLPARQAREIYDAVVRLAIRHLPVQAQADPRVHRIRELLATDSEPSLAKLATELGVSYCWASHMMSEVFRMSLRDYKAWRKQERVFDLLHSRRSLTEIAHTAGFTDSAHLSRTYQRWFGQPPSYSRNSNHVRVFTCR
ncbi:MAG: helix-turn-helix transcriptional regulator [Ectothiorhodospiraceae bacterium]|nr:helix-turn-helix transcriptional regulator [Ectothiorhodospiraceae bacterium]MCH8503438.1 AraC family transcriptional regulator [Ectothiorhodospiraceae bacterium]